MKKVAVLLSVLWLLLFSTSSAYAYLDPGSGSMVLQALLGGVAGVAVMVKLFWHNIRGALRFGKKNVKEDDTTS